jgi:threonine synthase
VWVKDDTVLPTGSLKDRASALVIRMALQLGQRVLTCASTGNAASSLAGLSAVAGLDAVLFVSARAPRAKLVQPAACGARLVCIDGSYDACYELSREASDTYGWYNRNTAYNPWTTEGKKSVAWELALQVPGLPDQVFVPTGDGSILSGVCKGFRDLVQLGWLDRIPRIVAVQAEGSAAIARAFAAGGDGSDAAVADACSVADSLVVNVPRNAVRAVRDVRACNGYCVCVSEADILAATPEVATRTGVFVEPAAAAAWAGLKRAREEDLIGPQDTAVLLLTGNGLKDVAAVAAAVELPAAIGPEWNTVRSVLGMYADQNRQRS